MCNCAASPTPAACSDEASWCPSVTGGQCYGSGVASTCCSSCQRLRISQTGILWQCDFSEWERKPERKMIDLSRY